MVFRGKAAKIGKSGSNGKSSMLRRRERTMRRIGFVSLFLLISFARASAPKNAHDVVAPIHGGNVAPFARPQ
jgi:hypothetical protein